MSERVIQLTPDMVERLQTFPSHEFTAWALDVHLTAGVQLNLKGAVPSDYKYWVGELEHVLRVMCEACHSDGYVATLKFT